MTSSLAKPSHKTVSPSMHRYSSSGGESPGSEDYLDQSRGRVPKVRTHSEWPTLLQQAALRRKRPAQSLIRSVRAAACGSQWMRVRSLSELRSDSYAKRGTSQQFRRLWPESVPLPRQKSEPLRQDEYRSNPRSTWSSQEAWCYELSGC